ncbi:hypothetical protein EXN66_Car018029 [Channa argus]|uniref:Uncharacterized protein n=1 Tax=Channa argus TaxID=215402 RepID=A0A6G1QI40_CHAAH|nr:hypothetical protein EXN66_Car018029 [Channa argus]
MKNSPNFKPEYIKTDINVFSKKTPITAALHVTIELKLIYKPNRTVSKTNHISFYSSFSPKVSPQAPSLAPLLAPTKGNLHPFCTRTPKSQQLSISQVANAACQLHFEENGRKGGDRKEEKKETVQETMKGKVGNTAAQKARHTFQPFHLTSAPESGSFSSEEKNNMVRVKGRSRYIRTACGASCQKAVVLGFSGCVEHLAMIWDQMHHVFYNQSHVYVVWLDLANADRSVPCKTTEKVEDENQACYIRRLSLCKTVRNNNIFLVNSEENPLLSDQLRRWAPKVIIISVCAFLSVILFGKNSVVCQKFHLEVSGSLTFIVDLNFHKRSSSSSASPHPDIVHRLKTSQLSIIGGVIMSSLADIQRGCYATKPIRLPSAAHKQSIDILTEIICVQNKFLTTHVVRESFIDIHRYEIFIIKKLLVWKLDQSLCPPVYKSWQLRAESY